MKTLDLSVCQSRAAEQAIENKYMKVRVYGVQVYFLRIKRFGRKIICPLHWDPAFSNMNGLWTLLCKNPAQTLYIIIINIILFLQLTCQAPDQHERRAAAQTPV